MTEAGIGRILVASLHQGISDLLPARLEFYENWLNPDGLRHGTIGLAPLHAVLSFLRKEGGAYEPITRRAGQCAADWTVASQWPLTRTLAHSLPLALRARVVLAQARRLLRGTYVGTKATVRVRKGHATVDVRGSLFCTIRDASAEPLCGFYAAAVSRLLELNTVPGEVRIGRCRAVGGQSCVLDVALDLRRPSSIPSLVTFK